jgi:serine/threonine protein kinase
MGSQGFRSRCGITKGHTLTAITKDGTSQSYQTMYPIGLGSNGEVWKACRIDADNDFIVVKFFAPVVKNTRFLSTAPLETDPERIERLRIRFMKESEAVKDAPPNTVGNFRGLSLLSETPYFCMEYRKGMTLFDVIRKHYLNEKNKLFYFNEICKIVTRLHDVMVHLDLKPLNILFLNHAKVSLLDLGSSKRIEELPLFKSGKQHIGYTWSYAAPEVRSLQRISKAADVFSLGCILFEILSGTRLDLSDISSSGIAPPMIEVIQTATHPDIRRRFQEVRDLRKAFLHAVKDNK